MCSSGREHGSRKISHLVPPQTKLLRASEVCWKKAYIHSNSYGTTAKSSRRVLEPEQRPGTKNTPPSIGQLEKRETSHAADVV